MSSPEMGGYTPEEIKLSPRDALVHSGIAERMIESIKSHKGTLDPEITYGVEDCDFRVEQTVLGEEKEMHTQVVIEMPNFNPLTSKDHPRVERGFDVSKGGSFGVASDPPLTQEQWDNIQEILKEQEQAGK